MWDIRRTVPIDQWPRARTVVAFELQEVVRSGSHWWLVVADGDVDLCDYDPGYEVNAVVTGSLRTLTRLWRGDVSWPEVLRSGNVVVSPTAWSVVRYLSGWASPGSSATPRVEAG